MDLRNNSIRLKSIKMQATELFVLARLHLYRPVQRIITSSNGTFSVLLAICAGKSPASGEFPTQRPVTRSFDVFFDLCLNKRLRNNREAGDLRRYRTNYDVIVMGYPC